MTDSEAFFDWVDRVLNRPETVSVKCIHCGNGPTVTEVVNYKSGGILHESRCASCGMGLSITFSYSGGRPKRLRFIFRGWGASKDEFFQRFLDWLDEQGVRLHARSVSVGFAPPGKKKRKVRVPGQ